jgi:hypothetical protein
MKRKNFDKYKEPKQYSSGKRRRASVSNVVLTEEKADKILAHMEEGNFYETACAMEGISDRRRNAYMKRGKELIDEMDKAQENGTEEKFFARLDENLFERILLEFYIAVQEVRARVEASYVQGLKQSLRKTKDWKGYKFMLEKMNKKWKETEKIDVNHKHSGAVKVMFLMPRKEHKEEEKS